jgi:hypothetical protein
MPVCDGSLNSWSRRDAKGLQQAVCSPQPRYEQLLVVLFDVINNLFQTGRFAVRFRSMGTVIMASFAVQCLEGRVGVTSGGTVRNIVL